MLLAVCLTACSGDDNEPEPLVEKARPSVTCIFSTNGLGDLTYNDDLMAGVMRFANQHGDSVDVETFVPSGTDRAKGIIDAWLAKAEKPAATPRLLVLASSEFEELLANAKPTLAEGNTVILLETRRRDWPDRVVTANISLYGVAYQAASALLEKSHTEQSTLNVVRACPGMDKLEEGVSGIVDAAAAQGLSDKVRVDDLSEGYEGFNMQDDAYRLTMKYFHLGMLPSIFPLCGGSALGIYKYISSGVVFRTVGMDVDCGTLGYNVSFSIVRQTGRLLYEMMERWRKGESQPTHVSFGLGSGYTFIVNNTVIPSYTDWKKVTDKYYDEALEKEKRYEANH